MQSKQITICACTSRSFISKEKVAKIAAAMKRGGYNVLVKADLCKNAMESSPDMPIVAAGAILACHPRAVQSQLNWLKLEATQIENIRDNSDNDVLSRFGLYYSSAQDSEEEKNFRRQIEEFPVENGTDAWYPVIDKKRCTECGKCHDFCLFGVYAKENKQVKVVQPQNCKNNCPACARMCPDKAIIFPKYEKSPINGGITEEETFSPEEMDKMYREKLQMRLQQRRAGISLLREDKK